MKITISSPDGLGDFILRMPMFRALREAGHELQLFMRRPAINLAAAVLPGVELREVGADPYHQGTRKKKNPFRGEHKAIRGFGPDVYVASLFALSFFDEVWFEVDRWRVPVAGFSTGDTFWPSGTLSDPRSLAANFSTRVDVPVAMPELEKNRLLGSAILGVDLPRIPPRLEPGAEALESARTILRAHGLAEGAYWIACVGTRSGLAMKDWGEENWREFLAGAIPADGRPIVFLGNPKEWESIERIRSGSYRSVNLAGDPPPLATSHALAALSCGYVGRDSGVMHLASASERRVMAAFSGGHWARFLPSPPAVVVTQAMSCRGCDFHCPYERPHCVTAITQETMREGWSRLLAAGQVDVPDAAHTGQERIISETQGGAIACPGLVDAAPLGHASIAATSIEVLEQAALEGMDTFTADEARAAEARVREATARPITWWQRLARV